MSIDWRQLFGGCYHDRSVLVTGHTGFKGSWLVAWLERLGARVTAFALPPAGTPNHATLLGTEITSRVVDLRDAAAVRDTVLASDAEVVFHLGAQAVVREGYRTPADTFDVNVMGLVHLLDAVRQSPSVRALVIATSDKCYRNTEAAVPFRETDPLGGRDPYSASKACAELVAASYRDSFLHSRVGLATARAGNVVGGGDWAADRIVPDLMRGASRGEAVDVRSPNAVRPWQHVLDPLAGYLLLGQRLLEPVLEPVADLAGASVAADAWNFGPATDGHLTVRELSQIMQRHWPDVRIRTPQPVPPIPVSAPYEAQTLHLDCSRARGELHWQPVWDVHTALAQTASWYRAWYATGTVSTHDDLEQFVRDAQTARAPWATLAQAA